MMVSDEFHVFGEAVNAQFCRMSRQELYLAELPQGEDLFRVYLNSFAAEDNPLFRTRTEHDCSCCKHFVRRLGLVVALYERGGIETVWDVSGLPPRYQQAADALADLVRSLPVRTVFRAKEAGYGTEVSREALPDGQIRRWHHFWGELALAHRSAEPEAARGRFDALAGVLRRGLDEFSPVLLAQVAAMLPQLYRGEEHLPMLHAFTKLRLEYPEAETDRARYVLRRARSSGASFRNTLAGTLAQDLAQGMPEDQAAAAFEAKVAPLNYKRPTALVTPRMIEDAAKTVRELGLELALERRLARLSDMSVRNVLWVDRAARSKLRGSVFESLKQGLGIARPQPPAGATITALEFELNVLPAAMAIELRPQPSQLANLMALTAPAHAEASDLFRWPGGIGWSYAGNAADSIKERVKAAGGNVDAKLRFSLSWSNYDDLDLHAHLPDGRHVYFGQKQGILDVDMNAGRGVTREPVENLAFKEPQDGMYEVWVNQYCRRETADVGFRVQIACGICQMEATYPKAVTGNVVIGKFNYSRSRVKGVSDVLEAAYNKELLVGQSAAQQRWGIATGAPARVLAVLLSPNYWQEEAAGNKHHIFVLEGCVPDEPVRGIYNEFLKPELAKHRKVFELLGNRTLCAPDSNSACGLGFTAGRGDTLEARVTSTDGSIKNYIINF